MVKNASDEVKRTVVFTLEGEVPTDKTLALHLSVALDRLADDLGTDLKYHIYGIEVQKSED